MVIDASLAELGQSGSFELFGHFKRLVHRVGFLCWVSPLALEPRYMERLIADFTRLDPAIAHHTCVDSP